MTELATTPQADIDLAQQMPVDLTRADQRRRHDLVVLDQLSVDEPELIDYELKVVENWLAMDEDEARRLSEGIQSHSNGYYHEREILGKYTSVLRRLRKEQASQIKEVLSEIADVEDPVEQKALYLDAVSYSPPVASRAMERMNKKAESGSTVSGGRIFSEQQIIEAAQDPEKFKQALIQATLDKPGIVLEHNSRQILKRVVEPGVLRDAFDVVAEDPMKKSELYGRLEAVLSCYPAKDREPLIEKLIEGSNGSSIANRILALELTPLLGEDRQNAIARQLFERRDCMPLGHALQKGIEKGIWTLSEVESKYLEFAQSNPRDDILAGALDIEGLNPSIVEQLRTTMRSELSQPPEEDDGLGFGSSSILSYNKLLTQEDIKTIVEAHLVLDFEKAMKEYRSEIVTCYEPEEFENLCLQYLATTDEPFSAPSMILDNERLSKDLRRGYMQQFSEEFPEEFLDFYLAGTFRSKPAEELVGQAKFRAMIQKVIAGHEPRRLDYKLEAAAEYFDTDEELKLFVESAVSQSRAFHVFRDLGKSQSKIGRLFSREEVELMFDNMVERTIEDGTLAGSIDYSLATIREMFGEQKLRTICDRVIEANPGDALRLVLDLRYLYSKDEIKDYVDSIVQTDQDKLRLMQTSVFLSEIDSFIGKAHMADIILSVSYSRVSELDAYRSIFKRFLSVDQINTLAHNMYMANPAYALQFPEFFASQDIDMDTSSVVAEALKNDQKMSLAGLYLQSNLGKVQRTDNESVRLRLLKELTSVYRTISEIEDMGLADQAGIIRKAVAPIAKDEPAMLESLLVLARLGDLDEQIGLDSFEQIQQTTVRSIFRASGSTLEPTDQQIDRVIKQLVVPANIGLYITQYVDSEAHKSVIAPMLESIATGSYQDWRSGLLNEPSLQAMKDKGLLPEKMTLQQSRIWREESSTGFHEAFSLEASSAVIEVQSILRDNIAELPQGSVFAPDISRKIAGQAGQEISTLGESIGALHRELMLLRQQPDQDIAKIQIDELLSEVESLEEEKKDLQLKQDIAIVMSLTEDAVASGTIQADGKKGKPVVQVLQRLAKNLGPQHRFVTDRLKSVFDSYRTQTGAVRDIDVVDTNDPRITIEIGEAPVASCQNYRDGIVNEALLGYTDPNTKILLLRSEAGRPVARAIYRILEAEDGSPALHVETIYAAESSDAVKRSMYRHAITKATALQMPVYISAQSQDEEGKMVETPEVSGIAKNPIDGVVLKSKGSRAPLVYVDSAGGAKENGVYEVTNLAQILPA